MCLCGASIFPRMQALTTRRKSLAFQHSDIPGKDVQLTQRPQRHSSPRETTAPLVATPDSSPHRLAALEPRPPPRAASPAPSCFARPELLRPPRAASPAPSCFAVTPRRRTAPRAPPPPRRAHTAHCRAATRRPTAAPSSSPAPRPELLRRHASPPHCASNCVWQRSSSATSASSSCCTQP